VRIWFPLATLLSVGWLLLVSMLISRGGDGPGPATPLAGDAATLLRQSQAAMLELDSFQSRTTGLWETRVATYLVAWQSPDSFHVLFPVLGEESSSVHPGPWFADEGFYEALAIGDAIYGRQCAAEGEGCQPWQESLRDSIYMPSPGPGMEPFWKIDLLGLMSDAQIVGREDIEGVPCIHIRGRANLLRAMTQSWRRLEEIRGPIHWGDICSSAASEAGGQTQVECHARTLGDIVAEYERYVPDQDKNPRFFDVWVGRIDKLLRRLEFTLMPDELGPGDSYTFSQFNEVDIQPPE
jgi:hypothetical protein